MFNLIQKETINKKKRTLKCDAVLFDLDGVLIDSTICVERHWEEWALKHQLDAGEILAQAHGVRSIEVIKRFAPHLDASAEVAFYTANEVADTDGVVPVDGARELMELLPVESWAIVTSCSGALARARLSRAGLPIPVHMITSDDVTSGKPDPEPYLAGARLLGIPPERCVVIEDAPLGVQAGYRARMKVIGIEGTRDRGELLEKGADMVVEQLGNLLFRQSVGDYRLDILDLKDSHNLSG